MFQVLDSSVPKVPQVTVMVLQSSLASSIMCWPVLEPQRTGGAGPSEVAVNWSSWHWPRLLGLESRTELVLG